MCRSWWLNVRVSTEGKFFGPNAESVAGTFHDKNQNVAGAFGADRD